MIDVGPQLLGRKPRIPDDRDFNLENYLNLGLKSPSQDVFDLITKAKLELKETTVPYKRWAATTYAHVENTHWWKALDYLSQAVVPLNPNSVVSWINPDPPLNQGSTGHCVGFGWAQWGNTDPVEDHFTNQDGHDIYYECKVIDGEPNAEDGSNTRSGAKAMKARGRLSIYAFAGSVDTAINWIKTKGSVVFGSDWTSDMFSPDSEGRIHPTGAVEGGHEYLGYGYDPVADDILFANSWGTWGLNGRFRIHVPEYKTLWANGGDACTAVELA